MQGIIEAFIAVVALAWVGAVVALAFI